MLNNSANLTESTEILSLTIRIIEGGILAIICLLSFFGNVSLWIVILKTRDLHKESNYLTLCLSFADILVSMGMPITCLTIFYGEWIFDDVMCQVLGFVNMVTFIGSVTSLAVISLNRYVKICKPYKYNVIFSRRNIFFMIPGVWLLSSALAAPPLLGWGVYAFLPNQSFCFCDWATSVSYTFFMVGTCFGGPCTIMTVCYVLILRMLRASSRKVFNFAPAEISSSLGNKEQGDILSDENTDRPESDILSNDQSGGAANRNSNVSVISNQSVPSARTSAYLTVPKPKLPPLKVLNRKEKRRQEEIRITALFLIVIFAFVISWFPFCIAMFMSVFCKEYLPRHFDMFTLLLGYANSCYNPFIYGVLNQRVKQGYKTVFGKCMPKSIRERRNDSS